MRDTRLKEPGSRQAVRILPDLAAALLAGGRSRRMGTDKALLLLEGRPMAERLVEVLREVSAEVFLACCDPNRYHDLEIPAASDLYPGCGPLAGLHAALLYTRKPRVLVLACDLGCVSSRLLSCMASRDPAADVVVAQTSDGRLHPTCAIYHRRCLPAVDRALSAGSYRMIQLLEDPDLRVLRFALDDEGFADCELADMNTPADFEACLHPPKP